jgi:hypothetical protein
MRPAPDSPARFGSVRLRRVTNRESGPRPLAGARLALALAWLVIAVGAYLMAHVLGVDPAP